MSERLASTFRNGQFTDSHIDALIILDGLKVCYRAEEVIPIFGEFDSEGRPAYRKPDVLIHDGRFGSGVILIDGDSHQTHGAAKRDEKADRQYEKMGLWVAHIPNSEVSWGNIEAVLSRHVRRVDSYGGALP